LYMPASTATMMTTMTMRTMTAIKPAPFVGALLSD
jgi:hypothetical protein